MDATKRVRGKDPALDSKYKRLRIETFIGIFIGYAGYYLVRNNLSIAMPGLIKEGFSKGQLGLAFSAVSIAYGLSKFFMATVSDHSKPQIFLPLGLLMAALINLIFGFVPALRTNVATMFVVLFALGWVNGMGWPPSGRTLVYWFSTKERGTATSIWNCAHNVGGAVMAPLATAGIGMIATLNLAMPSYTGAFILNGFVALAIAVIAFLLIKNNPKDYGLPAIEEWQDDYVTKDKTVQEEKYDTKELLFHHVLNNPWLWVVAITDVFCYVVRYGVQNWIPTYMEQVHHIPLSSSAALYMWFEIAGVIGTLITGWITDKFFKEHRGRMGAIDMLLCTVFVAIYISSKNIAVINFAVIAIGFFIYGPLTLISLEAIEFVDKNAAGTAAGLTGLCSYLIGSFSANAILGWLADTFGWGGGFAMILGSAVIAVVLFAITWNVTSQHVLDLQMTKLNKWKAQQNK
ncbi:MAG: MFS transporter [Lactobacillus sp.]|jgi:OPA family glycerol-3-phosphate transporter-like MFS transporter|nr:MFS transporter [Lactobacillus sp.]MCI1481981.1 MFS transporter [Lactobacillus sp.]